MPSGTVFGARSDDGQRKIRSKSPRLGSKYGKIPSVLKIAPRKEQNPDTGRIKGLSYENTVSEL
jgi:hypothetical protein